MAWQVCSGFAHGRPWANIGMNEMETHSTADEGVSLVRLTSDDKRMLAVTLPAFHLMDRSVCGCTKNARKRPLAIGLRSFSL